HPAFRPGFCSVPPREASSATCPAGIHAQNCSALRSNVPKYLHSGFTRDRIAQPPHPPLGARGGPPAVARQAGQRFRPPAATTCLGFGRTDGVRPSQAPPKRTHMIRDQETLNILLHSVSRLVRE